MTAPVRRPPERGLGAAGASASRDRGRDLDRRLRAGRPVLRLTMPSPSTRSYGDGATTSARAPAHQALHDAIGVRGSSPARGLRIVADDHVVRARTEVADDPDGSSARPCRGRAARAAARRIIAAASRVRRAEVDADGKPVLVRAVDCPGLGDCSSAIALSFRPRSSRRSRRCGGVRVAEAEALVQALADEVEFGAVEERGGFSRRRGSSRRGLARTSRPGVRRGPGESSA